MPDQPGAETALPTETSAGSSPAMSPETSSDLPTVSIVIRTYNEAAGLPKLFAGIAQQEYPAHEVIVVDSGSTDDTVAIARAHGARIVPIEKHEFSFGRALNRGCAVATGEVLLFASGHVYPERSDWIATMAAPFRDADTGLVYGRQRGAEVNKFSEHRIFERWFPNRSVDDQRHHFCNNANCAVRRSLWAELPYDEELTGLEDLAWAKVIRARGHRIAYRHEASIIHVHDETWAQVQNRYRREAIALSVIEPAERRGLGYFLPLALLNIGGDGLAALARGRPGLLGQILMFRANQYYGAWRGMRQGRPPVQEVLDTFYYPPTATRPGEDPVTDSIKVLKYE